MDFVDWCSLILTKTIDVVRTSSEARNHGVGEIRLSRALYGDELRTGSAFHGSKYRTGMLDAVRELVREGLLEERSNRYWMPTPEGRAVDQDSTLLWKEICAVSLEPEEELILRLVNQLSPQVGFDPVHAWLEEVSREPLMKEFGIAEPRGITKMLWPVSEQLAERGFIQRRALAGYHLDLKSTYRGLVWETRKRMLRKCDVFISHISDERADAISLQKLLREAFGQDIKVFVSSDYQSIPGGKVWFMELLEALKSAPVVLVLLSQSSVEKRWINFEAGIGIGAENLVIPLTISGFSKGDVGHPLAELQARSLADVDDVEGVLRDIAGNIDYALTKVDVAAFVNTSFSAGGSKLEATVNHVPVKSYDGYSEHSLIVGLVNNSNKTLSDYRIEIEVPNSVINHSTSYNAEVEGRRTAESRFFRSEGKDHIVKTLRPGDKDRSFFKIDLVIPPEETKDYSPDQKIVVKVFAGDAMTQKIEKTMKELLAMAPSFG
jgi:hypothetical protein